jgi:phosphoribosylanthranilate isomerase
MTLVKICGVSTPESALAAAEAGADLLGLVFYRQSYRAVSPTAALTIVRALRAAGHTLPVAGLFVNEAPNWINVVADEVGLDLVQLSGDESPADLLALDRPALRSVRVAAGADADALDAPLADAAARLAGRDGGSLGHPLLPLLDAHVPGAYGGTGARADWEVAAALAARRPILLAGGLTPANVGAAIREVRPFGVDVSSGVETDKVKDADKIRAFIAAVRAADREREVTA